MSDDDTSVSDSSSSEDEWEEPKLKYDRMKNDLTEILKKDFASCVALHSKFVALGTHWGAIHILDPEGNHITDKKFPAHHATVTGVSLDEAGEYVASCSDDGMIVVSGLCSDDHNQVIQVDCPVKSVALDPLYSKRSAKQLVFGTNKLIMNEKVWLRRTQQTVLHQGEGLVRNIKWRGQLIAWANDKGVKIYDTKQNRRITHIPRFGSGAESSQSRRSSLASEAGQSATVVNDNLRTELYPAHIAWKDDVTVLVGWANDIKVCSIRERPIRDIRERAKYCVIDYNFKTDFACCGIAPLADQIIAFAYVTHDDDDDVSDTETPTGGEQLRPQLRILEPNPSNKESYIEVSRDALTIRGFQTYRCSDYSLEYNDSCELFVISPKDVVIARERDDDDHITWLLQMNHHKEALQAVKEYGSRRRLKKHTYLEVGLAYLSHLIERNEFTEAAETCHEVLGCNKALWDETVKKFAEADQLHVISSFLPRGDFLLSPHSYEMVLDRFLLYDHQGFSNLLNEWPSKLYNISTVTSKVLAYLDRDVHNPTLNAALAKLYAADQRYDRALSIYLRLQHPDTFELIRKHNLFHALQDNILALMLFGGQAAIDLLLDNMEYVPIDKVVAELEKKPNLLHKYLHALFSRDSHLGSEYHGLQVRLYADFDHDKLLPFLKSSNYIPLEEALKICEERDFIDEQVFLLGRMGNASRALALITDHGSDISRAVDFCKEQNDVELWNELINKSLAKPEFIRGLLENIGTHVDPIILIRRIPTSMKIPRLRDALVKILQDYSMQTALWFQCKKVLSSDVLALMRKQLKIHQRPLRVDEESVCDACGRTLLSSKPGSRVDSLPVLVCFLCRHLFHDDCLQGQNRGTCSVCRGNIRHV